MASPWPWWPAGTRGNQAAFPAGGRVPRAVCLGFLTSQAGMIQAVVGPGVKMHIQHSVHGERSTTESHRGSFSSPTGGDVLQDRVGGVPSAQLSSSPPPSSAPAPPLGSIPCLLILCTHCAPVTSPGPLAETPGHGAPPALGDAQGGGMVSGRHCP